MADTLLAAHIMHAPDAKSSGKLPSRVMRTRGDLIGRGHAMIKHDHNAFRIAYPLNIAPVTGDEIVVEQDDGVELHRDHVAGRDNRTARFCGKNFFFRFDLKTVDEQDESHRPGERQR